MKKLLSHVTLAAGLAAAVILGSLTPSRPAVGGEIILPLVAAGQQGLVATTLDPPIVGIARANTTSVRKVNTRLKSIFSKLLQNAAKSRLGARSFSSNNLKLVNNLFSDLLLRSQRSALPGAAAVSQPNVDFGIAAAIVPFTTGGLNFTDDYLVGFTLDGTTYEAVLDQNRTATVSGKQVIVDYNVIPAGVPEEGTLVAALLRVSDSANVGVLVVAAYDNSIQERLEDNGVVNGSVRNTTATIPFSCSLTGLDLKTHATDDINFVDGYFAKQDVFGLGVPASVVSGIQGLVNSLKAQ